MKTSLLAALIVTLFISFSSVPSALARGGGGGHMGGGGGEGRMESDGDGDRDDSIQRDGDNVTFDGRDN